MSENADKINSAGQKLRATIEKIVAGNFDAADATCDEAYKLVEEVRDSLMTELQRLGSQPTPERDKADNALSELDEVSSELEQMGMFGEVDPDEVQELVDTLEGHIGTLDEVSL